MPFLTSTENAGSHGVDISDRGFPTPDGASADLQHWIATNAVLGLTNEGSPEVPLAPGQGYRGNAVIATTPSRFIAVITPGASPTAGIVAAADLSELDAVTEGTLGLFSKRPKLIYLETSDWTLALNDVGKVLKTMLQGKAEAAFVKSLGATGG